MECKHECPICGIQYEHLCDTPPKEPLGLCMIYQLQVDYMPPCKRKDYFLECSECRIKKELGK